MTVLNDCVNDARVLNEARALAECGHEVLIVGRSSTTKSWDSDVARNVRIFNVGRPRLRFNIQRAGSETAIGLWPWLRRLLIFADRFFLDSSFACRALSKILAHRPDVIHAHDLNTLPVGAVGSWFSRAELVYDSHELWIDQNPFVRPRPFQIKLIQLVEGFFISDARAVITVSEAIAEELAKMYSIRKPSVVRNCKFVWGQIETSLKDRLSLPTESFLAIYTGLITGGRGVEDFLEVMPSFPRLHFSLMGPSVESYQRTLLDRANQLGVHKRVHILPAVKPEEVPAAISGADFAYVPAKDTCRSYYLSLSNKFFEAVAAGLPVVTSNFPEFERLVSQYQLGETYSPSNLATLKSGVEKILDRSRLQIFSQNSVRAASELNWPKEKLKLIGLYRQLAAQPRRAEELVRA